MERQKATLTRTGMPIPRLRGRAFAFLFAGTSIPIIGLAFGLPFPLTLILTILYLVVLFGWVISHIVRIQRQSRALLLSLEGKSDVVSARPSILLLFAEGEVAQELNGRVRIDYPIGVLGEDDAVHIAPGNKRSASELSWTPRVRGVIRWHELSVSWTYPGALVALQQQYHFAWECISFPNAASIPAEQRSLLSSYGGERMQERALRESGEFDSLRAYAQGDDLRRVDWRHSAKNDGLLVRVYRAETHQRIIVALDCGRRLAARVDDRTHLDYACDAVAALLTQIEKYCDEIALFAFHHEVLSHTPCARADRHRVHIMRALASLRAGELESDYALVTRAGLRATRRSLVVLISSVTSGIGIEDIVRSLRPLTRRHLVLLVIIADKGLTSLAGGSAGSLEEACSIAAAQEQLDQIRARLDSSKRAGIHYVYCESAALPAELSTKYKELKAAGLL